MTFKEATDRAQDLGLTAQDISAYLGVKPHTYRLMRLKGKHGRNPPDGWQGYLLGAIDQRITELDQLRNDLMKATW
jgi:hypothetical protein